MVAIRLDGQAARQLHDVYRWLHLAFSWTDPSSLQRRSDFLSSSSASTSASSSFTSTSSTRSSSSTSASSTSSATSSASSGAASVTSSASGAWESAYQALGQQTVSAYVNADGQVVSVAVVNADGNVTVVPYTSSTATVPATTTTEATKATLSATVSPTVVVENDSSSHAGLIVGIIGIIVALIALFLVLLFYLRGRGWPEKMPKLPKLANFPKPPKMPKLPKLPVPAHLRNARIASAQPLADRLQKLRAGLVRRSGHVDLEKTTVDAATETETARPPQTPKQSVDGTPIAPGHVRQKSRSLPPSPATSRFVAFPFLHDGAQGRAELHPTPTARRSVTPQVELAGGHARPSSVVPPLPAGPILEHLRAYSVPHVASAVASPTSSGPLSPGDVELTDMRLKLDIPRRSSAPNVPNGTRTSRRSRLLDDDDDDDRDDDDFRPGTGLRPGPGTAPTTPCRSERFTCHSGDIMISFTTNDPMPLMSPISNTRFSTLLNTRLGGDLDIRLDENFARPRNSLASRVSHESHVSHASNPTHDRHDRHDSHDSTDSRDSRTDTHTESQASCYSPLVSSSSSPTILTASPTVFTPATVPSLLTMTTASHSIPRKPLVPAKEDEEAGRSSTSDRSDAKRSHVIPLQPPPAARPRRHSPSPVSVSHAALRSIDMPASPPPLQALPPPPPPGSGAAHRTSIHGLEYYGYGTKAMVHVPISRYQSPTRRTDEYVS